MKPRRSAADLDQQIRAAETSAYRHYGLEPTERIVSVPSPFGVLGVRLSIFGPDDAPAPPVLVLHGIASVSVLAAPVIAGLSDRRVIAVDWPGHGLSGPSILPPRSRIRAYVVAVLRALLDELQLTEVDVVGHSMGAQFGLYGALVPPERVRRLVLLGAPGAAFRGIRPTAIMVVLAIPGLGPRLLALPMSPEAFFRNNEKPLGVGALRDTPPELTGAAYLMGRRATYPASVASYFRAMLRGAAVRREVTVSPDELATLRQPTLLVWGDEDVFMRPLDGARHIAAIRDSHLVRLPEAGHAPWLQHPARVGHVVAEHLGAASIDQDPQGGQPR